MRRTLKNQPKELEQLVRAYLFCLAAADLTVSSGSRSKSPVLPLTRAARTQHIGATLYDLGPEGATRLGSWNVLTWGNVGITVVLFAWRMCWIAGVGRSRLPNSKKAT